MNLFHKIKYNVTIVVGDDQGDLWMYTHVNGILQIHFKGNSLSDFEIIKYTPENGRYNFISCMNFVSLCGTKIGVLTRFFV